MSILRIKDKNGKWVDVPSLNVEVNEKSVMAAIPTLGRIETGSYVGTGTWGESNPVTLTFDFVPEVVWVAEIPSETDDDSVQICLLNGMSQVYYVLSNVTMGVHVSWSGNSVSYNYNASPHYGAEYQFNKSGKTYVYYAIG